MFNLLPKDTVFFDLFEQLAGHAVTSAKHLHALAEAFPNADGPVQLIRKAEHEADELAHLALDRLDRTFITPFDREDIHELVGGLDDIVDEIDALAKRFKLYHIHAMEDAFTRQAGVLMRATEVMRQAVLQLRKSRKLAGLSDLLIEIHRLENEGDDNNHAAMSRLFQGDVAPLEVVKWKEIYDRIEVAIDSCEDVGNIIERIVLKNG